MDGKADRYIFSFCRSVGAIMARLLFATICSFLTSATPALGVIVWTAVSVLTTLIVTLTWEAGDIG